MSTSLSQQEQFRGALEMLADAHSRVAALGDRMTYPVTLSEYRELLEKLNLLTAIADGLRAFAGNMVNEERTP